MDFELPEELKMVQSLVRDFVNGQFRPLEQDLLGRTADMSDARMFLPPEIEERLIKMTKDMGLWMAGVPEELGGVGLSTLGNCLIAEELAQTIIPFNFGDVTPVLFESNTRQKERYLLPALNRQKCPYLALMEPDQGGDISGIKMRAEKVNNHYILNGKKLSFSKPGEDYFAVVFAITADNEIRDGVTCFLVDKGTSGFSVIDGKERTGWQSQVRWPMTLLFDRCSVPADNILGEVGKAFHLAKRLLPSRRVIRGARCVGVGKRLLEETTTQAQSWQSFGQPISLRTNIQAALADITMSIHASRLMVYEAAWKADNGMSIRREAAMVKLFTTQMIHDVVDRVAHVFNGPPSAVAQLMKRLSGPVLTAGATELALELQRSIIAGDILKGVKI